MNLHEKSPNSFKVHLHGSCLEILDPILPLVFKNTMSYCHVKVSWLHWLFNAVGEIKPQLTFSLFYDLSTFDPCFLLLPTAYSLGAMYFFPECKLGWVCPSDVCSIRIIRLSSFQIESVSALVWKRPVFQSWAYWRLACAHTLFSAFEDTEIHFLIRFPVSRLRRSCCNWRQSTVHSTTK